MNNTTITISEHYIQNKVKFYNEVMEKIPTRKPNFGIVYHMTLLKALEGSREGYNYIIDLYDISIDILNRLGIAEAGDEKERCVNITKQVTSGYGKTLLENSINRIELKID